MIDEPLSGTAGASAREQARKVHDRRVQATSARSQMATVLRALVGPDALERRQRQEEERWSSGARGEEMLAARLAKGCPSVPLLHDRRIPRSRANIDHIAFAATGVFVIDCKRYRGRVSVRHPLIGKPKLIVAGRDRTKLIDGLDRQVAAVRASLDDLAADVPVRGCLCFVPPEGLMADSGLPVIRTLRIGGHTLYYPRRLVKRLNRPGPLSYEYAIELQRELSRRLPPAS